MKPSSLIQLVYVSALTLGVMTVGACNNTQPQTEADSAPTIASEDARSQDSVIRVSNGVIRPPLPGQSVAAGYFTLTNMGADRTLVTARSSVSDNVELHTHLMEDGVMKMRRVDGVPVPAGGTVEFAPGGLHLMLFETQMPDPETDITFTLEFDDASTVTLTANRLEKVKMGSGTDHDEH